MSSEQKLDCILCEDVFDTKEELQVHFRKHGDPNFKPNKSETCGEKSSENSELVACDVCPEVFTTISKAITHKHKVHPDHDAKYFCPWCGKLFTMKHLYNKHIQSSHTDNVCHDKKTFHCDVCDVDFYLPSAMTNHNKFFHRQDTDQSDIGQSKKIKIYSQEILPIFYCAFCGEEYENKVNLNKHITDDHSDENQSPDEVLRCPVCDAIFYHLDAYEVHLTFHSVEDIFSVQNEMFAELEEFSLESVPPVLEKVENLQCSDLADAESEMNSMMINKILEIALDPPQEDRVKTKKHKKHKKSKKSAITLDEFLNMNKDVFGEGIDFQGIEEVPTRAVTKRLKTVKKPANAKQNTLKDLAKLQKQGIVIKKKTDTIANQAQGVKVLGKGQFTRPIKFAKDCTVSKPEPAISTSDDVLSKLLSQSNNSIKIVKKGGSQDSPKTDVNSVAPKSTETLNEEEAHEAAPPIIEEPDDSKDTTEKPNIDAQSSSEIPSADQKNDVSNEDDAEQSQEMNSDNENLPNEITNNKDDTARVSPLNNVQNSLASLSNLQKKGLLIIKPPKTSDNNKDMDIDEEKSEPEHGEEDYKSDNENMNGMDKDYKQNELDEPKTPNPNKEPLSVLKGLSHLITIKQVSKGKPAVSPEHDKELDDSSNIPSPVQAVSKLPIPLPPPPPVEKEKPVSETEVTSTDKNSKLDTIKNRSKAITIKQVNNKMDDSANESDIDSDFDHDSNDESETKNVVMSKNLFVNKLLHSNRNESNLDKVNNKKQTPVSGNSANVNVSKINTENSAKKLNADILKRLPNITTKPIVNRKQPPVINKPPQKVTPIGKNDGEIEIFNIDSSDDETDIQPKPEVKPTPKPPEAPQALSKNVTIKSVKQTPVQKVIKTESSFTKTEEEYFEEDHPFTDESDDDHTESAKNNYVSTKFCSQKLSNKNFTIKNALKNLGKNITVKSRNSSPSQSVKSQDHNTQDSHFDEAASDSDSNPGNVKITELNEPTSDNDANPENDMPQSNAIVQSPDDSFSDNDEIDDFEKEIKASTLPKTSSKPNANPAILNTLKNISKNITIKSLNEQTEKTETPTTSQASPEPNNQLALKPYKRPPPKQQSENSNKVYKKFNSASQSQKMSSMADSNHVNTVNKEVTVQTYQTETVIQEITTTVTKTIKTVNKSMNQEMRSSCQSSQMTMPKVQGMRPSLPRNFQGGVVRNPHRPAGPRLSTMRLPGPVFRPSRQVTPMRPNIARPSIPRMPTVRKPGPSNPVMGKPLKISPSAMSSANALVKRAHSDETAGPFSCFKKPKESLIPTADMSSPGSTHFASTSQSASHFSSTTKVVKGNSVMTSTQMKSEMSASAQQISRLNNAPGLKIVKTSQQMHTQEKTESNSMKRTTLEAIERLQKQGLLIKKPRVDVNEESEHSEPEDNDNIENNSSADERDE